MAEILVDLTWDCPNQHPNCRSDFSFELFDDEELEDIIDALILCPTTISEFACEECGAEGLHNFNFEYADSEDVANLTDEFVRICSLYEDYFGDSRITSAA